MTKDNKRSRTKLPMKPIHRKKTKPKTSKDLKGTVPLDYCFMFYHESSFPNTLKIELGSFQIFSKFVEIFGSQGAPPELMKNLPPVSTTPAVNLPPVPLMSLDTSKSMTPVENLLPVSTVPVASCYQYQQHPR